MNNVGIYEIRNIVNNKIYIGSSSNLCKRFITHRTKLNNNIHPNKHLQRSVNKYGINKFEFNILEYCTKDLLVNIEQNWINKTNCNNQKYGYNKRILAESNTGYTFNMPEEAKEKLRIIGLNRGSTKEFKNFMSNLHKNKNVSIETRLKSSKSHKGYKVKESTKEKISNFKSEQIINLDNGETYCNTQDCASKLNVSKATIFNWLSGKYKAKVNLKRIKNKQVLKMIGAIE